MKNVKIHLTFNEFINHVKNRNHERKGQALMNTLAIYRKDLADRIMGTNLDCYYQDKFYGKCLEWIEENW